MICGCVHPNTWVIITYGPDRQRAAIRPVGAVAAAAAAAAEVNRVLHGGAAALAQHEQVAALGP
eukprot:5198631-Prymnesium_polylepis.2